MPWGPEVTEARASGGTAAIAGPAKPPEVVWAVCIFASRAGRGGTAEGLPGQAGPEGHQERVGTHLHPEEERRAERCPGRTELPTPRLRTINNS